MISLSWCFMDLEKVLGSLYGDMKPVHIDPACIPCQETSDSDKICRNPLVSVRVVTYNHGPYIRECLDSVLAQETDFAYEIVIGEDCSTDKTREICFEYQRRYPEKIRVLWADVNVYKLGGNQARTQYHCRGDYIALLEGDDYWTDNRKLQKQIDLIRKMKAIGCVANYQTRNADGSISPTEYHSGNVLTQRDLDLFYPHTSTYIFRRDILQDIWKRYPNIIGHYDVILMHCMVEAGPVAFLQDSVSVYRITGEGIATSLTKQKKTELAIKQYLDLYLHGPRSCHRRFGYLVMTQIALGEHTPQFARLFWSLFVRQVLVYPKTLRAVFRYFHIIK